MKRILFIAVWATLAVLPLCAQKTVIGQQKTTQIPDDDPVFTVCEKKPEFPGGDMALMEFLMKQTKYPKDATEQGIQGRVVVQFIVEKDGSPSNAKVVKSVSQSLDEEALRVVRAMPKWTPGQQRGQNVRAQFTLPVTFRLQ